MSSIFSLCIPRVCKLFRAFMMCLVLGSALRLEDAKGDVITIPMEFAGDSWALYQQLPDNSYVPVDLYGITFWGNVYIPVGYAGLITAPIQNYGSNEVVLSNLTTGQHVTTVSDAPYFNFDSESLNGGYHNVVSFTISGQRLGHSFAAEVNGQYFFLNTTPQITGSLDEGNGPYMAINPGGYFNARAYTNLASGSYSPMLIDLTSFEQIGISNMYQESAWMSWNVPAISGEAKVIVPDGNYYYTIHTSGGSLQSLWPSWDLDLSTYVISGQVGWGETFWVSRDIDGSSTPVSIFNFPAQRSVDATPYISLYIPRIISTLNFQISENVAYHQWVIVHSDGYRTYPYLDGQSNGVTTFWDDDGIEVNLNLYSFSSEVDIGNGWYLFDETTGVNYGMASQVIVAPNGFHNEYPPGSTGGQLPVSRISHTFKLVQPNEQWNVQVDSQSVVAEFSSAFVGTSMERGYTQGYFSFSAPFNAMKDFSLYDETTGEYASSLTDWRQWYLPRHPVTLKMNASRWFNQLFLVQPNSQLLITEKGALQGSYSYTAGQLVFNSNGFYCPTTTAHPDAVLWVWDATRQEYLTADGGDPTSFLNAYDATDTDGDNLPDWWEKTKGTNPLLADSDQDGIMDYDEYVGGYNPHKKDNVSVVRFSVHAFSRP